MRLSKEYDYAVEAILMFGEEHAYSAEEFVKRGMKSPTALAKLYNSSPLGQRCYQIRCGVVSNQRTPLRVVEYASLNDESPAVKKAAAAELVRRFRKDTDVRASDEVMLLAQRELVKRFKKDIGMRH